MSTLSHLDPSATGALPDGARAATHMSEEEQRIHSDGTFMALSRGYWKRRGEAAEQQLREVENVA